MSQQSISIHIFMSGRSVGMLMSVSPLLTGSPLWSKEKLKPIVVREGVSLVLPCEPPAGLPPPLIFWMDNNFQRLPQSKRVSQSLNGDLYFSNVRREDSRNDYICYARFPGTQTIQQKQPINVKVLNLDSINDTMAAFYNDTDLFSEAPADERMPSFLIPKGRHSSKVVLRGHKLDMECIAEGRPTPEISWTKDGSDLPAGRTSFLQFNKTLQIDDVSDSEEGVYRCTASNKFGSVHHTFHVTVKAAPYWISGPPSNLVLSPGENGVLTCRASGKPKPLITWTKNVMPIESLEDDTMKVEDDMIIFRDVKTSNSAVYQCNVSNEFGYLLANAFVNVLSEPPRVLTPVNKKYEVIRNHRALLDCSFFGSPIPNITWFKDSRSSTLDGDSYSLHDNGTLEIRISRPRDSGKYTCVARNILGISENHVFLEVKEPTQILKQPEYRMIKRGGPVTFECKVKHDSSLIPTMTWLKDDEELPEDDRFTVEPESLTITDVMDSDAGMYTCIINTTLDHVSASAELTVVERPDPPTDLELTDQTKRSVVLTWIPGNEYNSPIKKFLIQYEDSLHHRGHWHNLTHVPGTRTSANLKLSPHVHYTFRVLALNNVGWSQPSTPSQMYKTDPAAPDENPTGVQGLGTEPNNLIISWKPLTRLQSNGPGLQYKVMYREKKPGSEWITTNVANNSRFVVSGTSTFAPYELKVQAVNNYGEGPEPAVVVGHSGEDVPKSAPTELRISAHNSTAAEVQWKTVSNDSIRGFLKGYKVHYWREHGIHRHHPDRVEKILTFSGNRSHAVLPGLHPFSDYSFYVRVFNGRGEGPPSTTKHFSTPEGVPGPPTSLVVSNPNLDSLTLQWSPPYDPNGHITGYTLKYQPVNNSNELGEEEVLALAANETSVTLPNLQSSTRYRFYLNAKTKIGAGPAITQEALIMVDEAMVSRQVDIATQGWFIGLMCAIALLILILLIICFIQRNKGGKYPVKEKEDAHTDPEFQPMRDDDCPFGEYSDSEDHKPLKGSRTPSNGTVKRDDSDDSLVDYSEGGDRQFNEDGSFIGQYSGKTTSRDTAAAEGPQSSEAPSPINAIHSLNSFV
uniref:Neuronal cell adhesion molecule n=1 Tax=Oryzias melastigma TaxID=30732 RepID=A0A3B3DCT4_ORYME